MKKQSPNTPTHLNKILSETFQSVTKRKDLDMIGLWDVWPDIVGTEIAQNTKPAAFKGSILLIHVNSSPWLHHLQFLKKDIIEKVNATMRRDAVSDIKFKIGNI